jgi:hypothetical protein
MKLFAGSGFVLATLATLTSAPAAAAENEVSVVVASGPHAGKYGSKVDVICFHSKSQEIFAGTYKDWKAQGARSFRTGGIRVYKPDVAGAKFGELVVSFGASDKPGTEYLVTRIPVTLTVKGNRADIAGEGATKDGIQVRVSASCPDVTQL